MSDFEPCHYPDCPNLATVAVPYPGEGPKFVLPLCAEHDALREK